MKAMKAQRYNRLRNLWTLLSECSQSNTPMPSFKAIAAIVGYPTLSMVSWDLKYLEGAGYIRREPRKARAIVVLVPLVARLSVLG